MRKAVDLSAVRPYADHLEDGIVQMSFTLPIPYCSQGPKAALQLAAKLGLARPEVIHHQRLTEGCTYFIVYGHCSDTVDFNRLQSEGEEIEFMAKEEVETYVERHVGRDVVVVGAATGTDTHSVGIDAILNVKGFHGHQGLEAYRGFRVYNMGSQVPNAILIARAIEVKADAILVSQTVSQQKLHIHNLTNLVELVEAEGVRRNIQLICGGPRVNDELAKELGFDAGFSRGCYPSHVATFIVKELVNRTSSGLPAFIDGGDPAVLEHYGREPGQTGVVHTR